MRFRTLLAASLLAVSLVPLAAFTVLQWREAQNEIARSDEMQSRWAERAALETQTALDDAKRFVLLTAEMGAVAMDGNTTARASRTLQLSLEQIAATYGLFENLHIDDKEAKSLLFAPKESVRGSNLNVDHSQRWHSRAASAPAGSVLVSDVFQAEGATDRPIINLATAIRNARGEVIGVAAAALQLEALGRAVERKLPEGDYRLRIFDKTGRALYPNALAPVREDLADLLTRPDADKNVVHKLQSEGERHYLAQSRTADGWHIVLVRDGANRMHLATSTLQQAGAALFLLVALILAVVWAVSGTLARGVTKLIRHIESGRTEPAPEDRVSVPEEFRLVQHRWGRVLRGLREKRRELETLNSELESEVQRRTEAFRSQHATLSALFRDMREGVLLFREDGTLLLANPEAERLLPGPKATRAERFESVLRRVMPETPDVKPELAWTENGRSLEAKAFPIEGAPGEPARGVLLRDRTEAAQAEALKESLLSVVAHELKTPVQAIRLQTESLLADDGAWSPDFREELLTNLDEAAKHLQSLINDWLDVARIDGGLFRIEKRVLSLSSVLRKAARLAKSRYDFTLRTEVEEDAACLPGDPERLVQLFSNLFTNSARYARPDAAPEILVRAARVGDEVHIHVLDNGVGIRPEDRERIFDRFYQVERGNRRRSGGTGLGLVICRAVCEAHGGSITALGRNDEPGADIFVRLPLFTDES